MTAHAIHDASTRSARTSATAARKTPTPARSCRTVHVSVSGGEKTRYSRGIAFSTRPHSDATGTPAPFAIVSASHDAAAHAAYNRAGTTTARGHPAFARGRRRRSSHGQRKAHARSSAVRAGSGASSAPAGARATASVSPSDGLHNVVPNTAIAASDAGAPISGATKASARPAARAAPTASRRTSSILSTPNRLTRTNSQLPKHWELGTRQPWSGSGPSPSPEAFLVHGR